MYHLACTRASTHVQAHTCVHSMPLPACVGLTPHLRPLSRPSISQNRFEDVLGLIRSGGLCGAALIAYLQVCRVEEYGPRLAESPDGLGFMGLAAMQRAARFWAQKGATCSRLVTWLTSDDRCSVLCNCPMLRPRCPCPSPRPRATLRLPCTLLRTSARASPWPWPVATSRWRCRLHR